MTHETSAKGIGFVGSWPVGQDEEETDEEDAEDEEEEGDGSTEDEVLQKIVATLLSISSFFQHECVTFKLAN